MEGFGPLGRPTENAAVPPAGQKQCCEHRNVSGHLIVAGDVWIHNRDDLVASLDGGRGIYGQSTDLELIAAAWRKWGAECPKFIVGEFAFAVWDGLKRSLFLCRDQMGFRRLLYWRSGTRLVFCNDPLSILRVPGVERELNRRAFACAGIMGGNTLLGRETPHQGIMSVPAGSSITVDARGLKTGTYWEPDPDRVFVPGQDHEAFDALRDLLAASVKCRLREGSRPAALLSGGLDSSAIVGTAAQFVAAGQAPLLALAAVPPGERDPRTPDEREFIDEFRSWEQVQIEMVTAEGHGPFDRIEEPERFAVGPGVVRTFYLYDAFAAAARSNGAEIVFDGFMGEIGMTAWARRYYLELAANLQWRSLARELRALQRVLNVSPLRFLARELRSLAVAGHRREKILMNRHFLNEHPPGRPERCYAFDHRAEQVHAVRWVRKLLSRDLPPREDVRMTYPLADKRLVEYCLALPGRFKVRDGFQRYLARGALKGVLPERIRLRTGKVAFSPDYPLRYARQIAKARDFVASIGRSDPVRSVVDVDRLWDLLQAGNRPLITVPATIYAICFLRQFPAYRK